MMSKKAMVSMILASLISVCALAACNNAGDGTTDTPSGAAVGAASGDQDQQQEGDWFLAPRPEKILQPDAIYDLGQMVQQIDPLPEDEKNVGVEYTVHKAVLFDNAAQAGIAADQMITGEIFVDPQGNTDTDAWASYDREKLGFLLCDITLKNVNVSLLNIQKISLVYAPLGETVREIAYPSYFSNPKKDSREYYHCRLGRGNSIEVQVGWQADFSGLNKQDIYLAVNFDSDLDTTYIRLGL